MCLVCKICGYKQHDAEACNYYSQENPNTDLHDVNYICGACQDMEEMEEEKI